MKHIVECLQIENAIVEMTYERVFFFWKCRRNETSVESMWFSQKHIEYGIIEMIYELVFLYRKFMTNVSRGVVHNVYHA